MDYVARPGKQMALHLAHKHHKSSGIANFTIRMSALLITGALIFQIAWFLTAEMIVGLCFYGLLLWGLIVVLASVGYSCRAAYCKRMLKPYLKNGDVLEVDTSVAEKWRGERKNDQRIDEDDLFELQTAFNAMFSKWRRELSADS